VAHLVGVVVTATVAFVGTNIDDFVVLLLLILGMPLDSVRWRQIFTGQYLGFCALLLISTLGAVALRDVSDNWVRLLGLIPLTLGIRGFLRTARVSAIPAPPVLTGGTATVAIITTANGGDNITVYALLFRRLNLTDSAVTVLVFLLLLGGLCAAALLIGKRPKVIPGIIRRSRWLTPTIFVTIGALLLIGAGTSLHFRVSSPIG
jgi:cadmium resistance protein CadD (predicted permease)